MATRMQQRRGTAAQWVSSNAGDGPILNAGEIGWESDTNKFKIGDGVSYWDDLTYFVDATDVIASSLGAYLQDSDVGAASGVVGLDASKNAIVTGSSIIIEGATDNAYETTLTVTDPTADRTITFPNATGTVVLADSSGNVTVSGDLTVSGTTTTINSTTINATTGIVFEGLTDNAFETTLTVTDPTADRTVTFQDATGTVVLRDSTDTLTNKSISLGSNTVTSTLAQLNTAVSDADVASLAGTETLTNKTINLTSNTLTGTKAQFNTAMSDADFATLAGTETLTNKTIDITTNTLTGVAPLASPTFTGTVTLPSGTVTSTMILDGTIATADIADAAVTSAKIANDTIAAVNIAGDAVTSSKIASSAVETAKINDLAVTTGKIAEGAVTSAKIANDTIVDADINSAAAIAQSKISGLTTDLAAKAPLASPTFTGTVTIPAGASISGFAPLAAPALTGDATAVNLTVSGNLTVNGTTTNLNSTNLVIEDKNIILGDTASPTDVTADGGGITLKGATDKTLNWVDATDAWTSSEDFNLLTGKAYEINGTSVLSGTTLGSGVTASSLTSVGTITSGTWTGTAIAIANGGTGATTAMTAATALLPSQTSNSGKYLTTDGSGTLSWGTVSGYSAPTLGNVSIASGSTTTTITGLVKINTTSTVYTDGSGFEVNRDLMLLMGAF